MELKILGKKIDSSLEHELFADEILHPFGFNARIVFAKESPYEGRTDIYHNLTEIHNRFKGCEFCPQIAFESDIHYVGGTRRINEIVSVRVTKAKHLYKSY